MVIFIIKGFIYISKIKLSCCQYAFQNIFQGSLQNGSVLSIIENPPTNYVLTLDSKFALII